MFLLEMTKCWTLEENWNWCCNLIECFFFIHVIDLCKQKAETPSKCGKVSQDQISLMNWHHSWKLGWNMFITLVDDSNRILGWWIFIGAFGKFNRAEQRTFIEYHKGYYYIQLFFVDCFQEPQLALDTFMRLALFLVIISDNFSA